VDYRFQTAVKTVEETMRTGAIRTATPTMVLAMAIGAATGAAA
jgi:hypothetical protein